MSLLRSVALLLLFGLLVAGQSFMEFSELWQHTEEYPAEYAAKRGAPQNSRLFALDLAKLSNFLSDAPSIDRLDPRGPASYDKIVPFPTPNGKTETFRVVSAPTLTPEQSVKTGIRTFQLMGHSNRNLRGSLTISPQLGADAEVHRLFDDSESFQIMAVSVFHLQFRSEDATDEIVPSSTYHVFSSRDNAGARGACGGDRPTSEIKEQPAFQEIESLHHNHGKRTVTLGSSRTTYRIAIAATKEFTAATGGSQSSAFSRVTAITNEVNTIYNVEFNVQLQITSDQSIMATSGSPGPWGTTCNTNLDIARTQLATVVGDNPPGSSYDLGHVYGSGGLGIAYIGVLCSSTYKSGGCSHNSPTSTDFSRMVAHEIGHMFGSFHTHSTNATNCFNSARPTHTREPGAGSTIMAYGPICVDAYQSTFDLYFHSHSLLAAQTEMNQVCGTTSLPNNLPSITIDVPTARTIPIDTPFRLSASATDADGDSLTYCWEQYNVGEVMQSQAKVDDGVIQLFRSYPAVDSGYRIFPQDPEVRTYISTGEQLPAVGRASMPFNLVVRDGKGWTMDQSVDLVVDGTKGPFSLTTTTATTGANAPIAWSVASTDTLSANVNLKLFNGVTGDIVSVKLSVPNSGSANLCIPLGLNVTDVYKLRVEAVTGIWFDQKTITLTMGTTAACTVTTCDAGTETIDVKICSVKGNTSGGVSSTTQTSSTSSSSPASTRQGGSSWATTVYDTILN